MLDSYEATAGGIADLASQRQSLGRSASEIVEGALAAARPAAGLSWLDIGCGTGELLRAVRDRHSPADLTGVDLIDWLAPDLRSDVTLVTAPAEEALRRTDPADRVLLIECLDDFDGPWTVLRRAVQLVAPGGLLVITVPNISNLRHRLELLVRGCLTAYRPDNLPQRTPVLPHIVEHILVQEGLEPLNRAHLGADVIPLARGRTWPMRIRRRWPRLTSVSVLMAARARA